MFFGLMNKGRNSRASSVAGCGDCEIPVHGRPSRAERLSMRMGVRSRCAFHCRKMAMASRSSRMSWVSRSNSLRAFCGSAFKWPTDSAMVASTGGLSGLDMTIPSAPCSRGPPLKVQASKGCGSCGQYAGLVHRQGVEQRTKMATKKLQKPR